MQHNIYKLNMPQADNQIKAGRSHKRDTIFYVAPIGARWYAIWE